MDKKRREQLGKFKNHENLLVEVFLKEKFFEINNEKNEKIFLWKYSMQDQTGIKEIFSFNNQNSKIGKKVTIHKITNLFYRGRKLILGSFGERKKTLKFIGRKQIATTKNYNKIEYKKFKKKK